MSFGLRTMQDGNKHVNLRQGDMLVIESLLHKTEVVVTFLSNKNPVRTAQICILSDLHHGCLPILKRGLFLAFIFT